VKKLTFKELRKIVTPLKGQERQQTTLFSNRILNKPFWIWNIKEHKATDILTNGYCCFNHIIGLQGGLDGLQNLITRCNYCLIVIHQYDGIERGSNRMIKNVIDEVFGPK
jgi:hypothetical protein